MLSKAKYGIEIECIVSEKNERSLQTLTRRAGWNWDWDGSIRPRRNTQCGIEIKSPILRGRQGLRSLKKICRVLKSSHVKVNKSCGLHIHFGVNKLGDALKTAILYTKFQKRFNRLHPSHRRHNFYCKSYNRREIKDMISDFEHRGQYNRCKTRWDYNDYEHHNTVGVDAFFNHGTVEFRQHAGTINYAKIAKWIKTTERTLSFAQKINEPSTILKMKPRMFRQIVK